MVVRSPTIASPAVTRLQRLSTTGTVIVGGFARLERVVWHPQTGIVVEVADDAGWGALYPKLCEDNRCTIGMAESWSRINR